ncbi:MAG TPA: hypothetical protein VFR49_15130 [Solirubrobacteraceae bacterium]|nr:hypothetical protein [Solirubrobacteraceae bacterium]
MGSHLRGRLVAVVVVSGVLAVVAGGSALAAAQYPASLRHVFVNACTKSAVAVSNGKISHQKAVSYCTSALTCISRKLTLAQFERVVLNMQSGAANPNAKVLTQCEKAAAKHVLT